MMGLEDRIAQDGITAEAEWTDPPRWAQDRRDSSWYNVTLHYDGRAMTVPFGMGPALTEEPTAADVLNCLASDASGYENAQSFEDWASEYGYDPDSRSAERTYNLISEQIGQLRAFLGEQYDAYLYETESL